eukprot:TRINITY_DN7894_c0_g1_i4.p1 TRINITY_DN7894_c0_g1~~TRINITY_DN7894_c0_g1_i4.p1  ORF type:complete len:600 (-),score=264.23 TRINITY_DN7894_c0_g1_i4:45-1796(-)
MKKQATNTRKTAKTSTPTATSTAVVEQKKKNKQPPQQQQQQKNQQQTPVVAKKAKKAATDDQQPTQTQPQQQKSAPPSNVSDAVAQDINEIKTITDKTIEAANALLKHRDSRNKSNALFDEDDFFYLTICLNHIPVANPSLKPIKIYAPHSISTPQTEICLFVDDKAKARAKLEQAGVKVAKFIHYKKLATSYRVYEAKHKLANSYDLFLVEAHILSKIPRMLGTPFFKKKKAPIAVDLNKGPKKVIEDVLHSTFYHRTQGVSSAVKVGLTSQTAEQVAENVVQVVSTLVLKSVLKWKDVQSLSIKLSKSTSLPIYNSLNQVVEAPKKKSAPKLNISELMKQFVEDNYGSWKSDDEAEPMDEGSDNEDNDDGLIANVKHETDDDDDDDSDAQIKQEEDDDEEDEEEVLLKNKKNDKKNNNNKKTKEVVASAAVTASQSKPNKKQKKQNENAASSNSNKKQNEGKTSTNQQQKKRSRDETNTKGGDENNNNTTSTTSTASTKKNKNKKTPQAKEETEKLSQNKKNDSNKKRKTEEATPAAVETKKGKNTATTPTPSNTKNKNDKAVQSKPKKNPVKSKINFKYM